MNLTVPQVVSQMVTSTVWATGSAIAAKFVREKPLTGLMFGTAYSLITLPVNLETQSFYSNVSSPSEEAMRQSIAVAQMVIATFIGAKMVNLFGRPLTPIRAYRIQCVSMGLWSTIGVVIAATSYFYFVNHNPKPDQAIQDQVIRRGAELGISKTQVGVYVLSMIFIPVCVAVSAIAARRFGDRVSDRAWIGAGVGGTGVLITQFFFSSLSTPYFFYIDTMNWLVYCKFNLGLPNDSVRSYCESS